MNLRILALVAAALTLAGCGDLLPKPPPAPELYRLTAAADFPASGASGTVQLAVDTPLAEAALDTARIALSRSPTTLDYFADAAWTDRLPVVLQARLVDTFANAHRVIAFTADSGAAHSDAVLTIALRHFEAQYADAGPPHWRIELTANLVNAADRKVIATRIFSGDAAVPQNGMAAIVASADEAWRGVAKQIVDWAADNLAHPTR